MAGASNFWYLFIAAGVLVQYPFPSVVSGTSYFPVRVTYFESKWLTTDHFTIRSRNACGICLICWRLFPVRIWLDLTGIARNCSYLEEYYPPLRPSTYCVCFPRNILNCWMTRNWNRSTWHSTNHWANQLEVNKNCFAYIPNVPNHQNNSTRRNFENLYFISTRTSHNGRVECKHRPQMWTRP